MDSINDYCDHHTDKMRTISCLTCALFTGDVEDTGNGFVIVKCDDGKMRCTTIEAGCPWYEEDIFRYVKDIQ